MSHDPKKAYGPDHPDVARDVNNLGLVLRQEGDLAQAKAAFQRALAIFERAYGPDHANTRIARENLDLQGRRRWTRSRQHWWRRQRQAPPPG